jgi:hypothetical protein
MAKRLERSLNEFSRGITGLDQNHMHEHKEYNKRLFSDSRTGKGHKSREIETVNVWMRAGLVVGRDGAVAAPGTASLDPAVRDGYSVCLGVRVHEQEDEREDDLGHATLRQRSSSTRCIRHTRQERRTRSLRRRPRYGSRLL